MTGPTCGLFVAMGTLFIGVPLLIITLIGTLITYLLKKESLSKQFGKTFLIILALIIFLIIFAFAWDKGYLGLGC